MKRDTEQAYRYLVDSGVTIVTLRDGCHQVVLEGMEGIGQAEWARVNAAAAIIHAANPHYHYADAD